MLVIAHRGDHSSAPENSLEAFQRALDAGADGIELDVRTTADGVPVVMHDPSLRRTAGLKLRVSKSTSAQISKARLANGEEVPLFSDVVERFGGRTTLYVELKGRGVAAEAERLALSKPGGRFVFSSFDARALEPVQGIPRALLWDKRGSPVGAASRLGCSEVHVRLRRLTARMVPQAHVKGLSILVWDVGDKAGVLRAARMDVDGIITDDIRGARFLIRGRT